MVPELFKFVLREVTPSRSISQICTTVVNPTAGSWNPRITGGCGKTFNIVFTYNGHEEWNIIRQVPTQSSFPTIQNNIVLNKNTVQCTRSSLLFDYHGRGAHTSPTCPIEYQWEWNLNGQGWQDAPGNSDEEDYNHNRNSGPLLTGLIEFRRKARVVGMAVWQIASTIPRMILHTNVSDPGSIAISGAQSTDICASQSSVSISSSEDASGTTGVIEYQWEISKDNVTFQSMSGSEDFTLPSSHWSDGATKIYVSKIGTDRLQHNHF